jgi:hypothetical protein
MMRERTRGRSPPRGENGQHYRERMSMGDKGKKDKDKGQKQKQAKQTPAKGKPAADTGAKKK